MAEWPSLRVVHDEDDSHRGAHGDSVASEDTSVADGRGGGALEPLWDFEAAHHFLLANELAHRHGTFVDGLYDAMERVQSAIELQSERVLAVLHDKDVRINELEEELSRRRGSTEDAGVQAVMRPQRRHVGVQCVGKNEEEEAKQRRIEEQEEHIEVLMDELERVQKALRAMEVKVNEAQRGTDERCEGKTDQCAQTEEAVNGMSREEAETTIMNLQAQLIALERKNGAFREEQIVEKSASERLETWERQLEDAMRAIEATATCSIAPLCASAMSSSCVDMEHQLQMIDLEKEELVNEVLELRAALASGQLQFTPKARESTPPLHKECVQVHCKFMLKRIVHVLRMARNDHVQLKTAELRRELRRLLHEMTSGDRASMIARVVHHCMGWEKRHVDEIATLHQSHRKDKECAQMRVLRLLDEIQRLQQVTLDQEAELRLLRNQRSESSRESCGLTNDRDHASSAEINRRQIILEQQIQSMKEQLRVANGVIRALSTSVDLPSLDDDDVRGSKQPATKNQLAVVAAVHPPAIDTQNTVALLMAKLQELQAQQFKRIQPVDVTRHNVLEYFRLEKESLHFRTELKQREAEVLQLRAYVADMEKGCVSQLNQWSIKEVEMICRETTLEDKQGSTAASFTFYPILAKLYAQRIQHLNTELSKARSRIHFLERDINRLASSTIAESAKSWQHLISTLQEHHKSSVRYLKEWIARYGCETKEHESHGLSVDNQSWIFDAYNVLLTQYESLALEFQALELDRRACADQGTLSQDFANSPWGGHALTKQWVLQEKVHVLERRLLEAQVCVACSKHVSFDRSCHVDVSTSTDDLSSTASTVEYRGNDPGNSMSASTTLPQLPSSGLRGTECVGPDQTRVGIEMKRSDHDRQLEQIQRDLEASMARIAELSSQKDKLKTRLDEAKKINRKQAQDNEILITKRTQPQSDEPTIPSRQAVDLELQLHACNGEISDLRSQLEQWKIKFKAVEQVRTEAEHKVKTLEGELLSEKSNRDEEHNKGLETYMERVNQTLESIERERARLAGENHELQEKLRILEGALASKITPETRSSSTETDAEMEMTYLANLPAHTALQFRVTGLENELSAERSHSEALRTELQLTRVSNQHQSELQIKADQDTHEKYARLLEEIKSSHDILQQEFLDYQSAATEAAEQAARRIGFLMKCVEECSRLVDASDKDVGMRDLYDTVVALANKVVSKSMETTSKRGKETPKTVKAKPPSGVKRPKADESTSSTTRHIETVHAELEVDTLRVRVARLEASLHGATLKNKTFEDMIEHLEAQMNELRDEVKDRMEKESSLLTKQGQMKVEVANLKSQCVTLTSRLAEACGDLARTQDALKAAESEIARQRNALQRKTDLLSQQKKKFQDAQAAHEGSLKRIAQLETAQKSLASTLAKQKEQAMQLQEVRHQCAMYRDSSAELSDRVDKLAQLKNDLQSRVKTLRLENGSLRDQLREFKARLNDREESERKFQSDLLHSNDPHAREPMATHSKSAASATVEALTAQVKSLKKRVLDKQEVIVAYKTKVAELDAELVLQRTKAFDLAQVNRQQQQMHREKELTMMQGATSLKEELEAALVAKNEHFDGLRASIFDACEVFVRCYQPPESPRSTSSASSVAFSWPETTSGGGLADDVLQELRRYADLSPDDLVDLHITSTRHNRTNRGRSNEEKRLEAVHLQHLKQKHGEHLLRELEHALEVSPHDCRAEICRVLEFLTASRDQSRPARRY